MDHLGFLTNYLAVLDAGSLSGGARIQGISQPALSQQIASLEGYYGETLVHRSSSGVSPTRAGTMVAKYATQIQATHRRLLLDLDTLGQSPNGQLDISTGQALAQICIADVVYGLRHSQPDLDLRLHTQDRLVDVLREPYDLAIRAGNPGDGDAIARKIANLSMVLVAHPKFIARHGVPITPNDLSKIEYIDYSSSPLNGYLPMFKDGGETQVSLKQGMQVDTPALLMNALSHGLGFTRGPIAMMREEIETGQLVILLPDYTIMEKPIWAIYPHRHALPHRAHLFLGHILERFSKIDGILPLAFPEAREALDLAADSDRKPSGGPVAQLVRAERS